MEEIDLITIDEDDLAKYKKDDLYSLCLKYKILNIFKSSKKSVILKELLKRKTQMIKSQKKKDQYNQLFEQNRLERRSNPHGYKLPVLIISQIFRYCWRMCTEPGCAPTFKGAFGYKAALSLMSVNKQFFEFTSQWFNNVIVERNMSFPDLDSPWCPIKKIDQLTVAHSLLDDLLSRSLKNSDSKIQMCQTIEKLTIIFDERSHTVMKVKCFKNLSTLMTNLTSFKPVKIKLERSHLKLLTTLPNLINLDLSLLYNFSDSEFREVQSEFLVRPMRKFILPVFYTSNLKHTSDAFRNSVEVFGFIVDNNATVKYNFPKLRKIKVHSQKGMKTSSFDLFDESTIQNISHIVVNFRRDGKGLFPWTEKMKSLKVIQDFHKYQEKDIRMANKFIMAMVSRPTTFILPSEYPLDDINLDGYVYQYCKQKKQQPLKNYFIKKNE